MAAPHLHGCLLAGFVSRCADLNPTSRPNKIAAAAGLPACRKLWRGRAGTVAGTTAVAGWLAGSPCGPAALAYWPTAALSLSRASTLRLSPVSQSFENFG